MAIYTVLDISRYNTVSNYSGIVTSVDGVIIRAGYRGYGASGTLVTDSMFEQHYNGLKEQTKIGVYWLTQAVSETEAEAEADYLYKLIKDKKIDFPIYVNSEYSSSADHTGRADNLDKTSRTRFIIAFLERMKLYGYRGGVYASDSWYNGQLILSELVEKNYSIWVSRYSSSAPQYVSDYDGWQYTNTGSVEGVLGNVNKSTFYKDVANWEDSLPNVNTFDLTVPETEFSYTGEEIKPGFTLGILEQDKDYVVLYENNINAGTGTVIIKGINSFGGTRTFDFTINTVDISTKQFTISIEDNTYTGGNITGTPNIDGLTYLKDYTVKYYNNINHTTSESIAYAIATGVGNYIGECRFEFTIKPRKLSSDKFSLTDYDWRYTGQEIKPKVISSLVLDKDYTIIYIDNIEIGNASVKITGMGNYTDVVVINFSISTKSIGDYNIKLDNYTFVYDGIQKTPRVTVYNDNNTLVEGRDYEVTYKNNINAGTASVWIDGILGYTGYASVEYTIVTADINNYKITLDCYEYNYNTAPIKPVVTVEGLSKNIHYKVTYSNNIEPGTGKVLIKGIGNNGGSVVIPFTINTTDINSCYAKYGWASNKTIYRIDDGSFHIYADQGEKLELKEGVDFIYTAPNDKEYFQKFNLITVHIKGIGFFYGNMDGNFRVVDKEPDITIDPSDDGVYNFGDIDLDDETAFGDYNYGDLDETEPEPIDPEAPPRVHDDENYDFEEFCGIYLDTFNEDTGTNIDDKGNADHQDPEDDSGNDDGKFNFGDIDAKDESAVGDYDFGDLDEGVDPDSVAIDDYDFNIFASDEEEWVMTGTPFNVTDLDAFETYSSKTSFTKISGIYYVYNSAIKNERIRMCRLESYVDLPARSFGWVNIEDLKNIGQIVVKNRVSVNGKIYASPDGTGDFIDSEDNIFYVRQIDKGQEYPYGLSLTAKSKIIGYATEEMLTRID